MTLQSPLVCYLYGVGAWGPGFNDWAALNALLASGTAPTEPTLVLPKAEVIPGNERRRAPPVVRAAVEVSTQACAQAQLAAQELACVFGSGLGDTDVTDYLCAQLATPEKQLSPTRFHNSVHNAAAGYWTIATGSMRSANSIAAYNETAGTSLLEAVLQAQEDQEPILVTLFDLAAQGIYQRIYTTDAGFACALVLAPAPLAQAPLAKLTLTLASEPASVPAWPTFFAHLYTSNPSARILPVLHALTTAEESAVVSLALADHSHLKIVVEK